MTSRGGRAAYGLGCLAARPGFQRQMGLAPLAYRRQFAPLLADAPA